MEKPVSTTKGVKSNMETLKVIEGNEKKSQDRTWAPAITMNFI